MYASFFTCDRLSRGKQDRGYKIAEDFADIEMELRSLDVQDNYSVTVTPDEQGDEFMITSIGVDGLALVMLYVDDMHFLYAGSLNVDDEMLEIIVDGGGVDVPRSRLVTFDEMIHVFKVYCQTGKQSTHVNWLEWTV